MLRAVPLALAVVLAGCFGGEPEAASPAAVADPAKNASEQPSAGICVVGVPSACNSPENQKPVKAPRILLPPPVFTIDTPPPREAGEAIALRVSFPGVAASHLASVTWTFDEGPQATGLLVNTTWSTPGVHVATVNATSVSGSTASGGVRVGIRLNETFQGTITSLGGSCVPACGSHRVVLPAFARLLRAEATFASSGAEGSNLTLVAPDGTLHSGAGVVEVLAPAAGDWTIRIAADPVDPAAGGVFYFTNEAYTVTALADFVDDLG